MSPLHAAILFVVLQRSAELLWSARNTRRLKARGAVEFGERHYPLIVAVHVLWLVALVWFVPGDTAPSGFLLTLFGLLQLARLWVLTSLGPYWTTRIITLPGAPLVRRGPYRLFRHPNYLVVTAEIAVLPAAFGAWWTAGMFSLLNAAVLWHRVRVEESALAGRLGTTAGRS